MNLRELKNEYLVFLENTPLYLKKSKEIMNKNLLDFSYKEIETFITIYVKYYENADKLNLTYKELSNVLYAYLGTAFVNYNEGIWELNDVKTDEAYGSPTIINWGGKDYPWSRISPKVWKIIIERDKTLGDYKVIKRIFK